MTKFYSTITKKKLEKRDVRASHSLSSSLLEEYFLLVTFSSVFSQCFFYFDGFIDLLSDVWVGEQSYQGFF
jgi:hypothetical protein